jgi:hypothetical protein
MENKKRNTMSRHKTSNDDTKTVRKYVLCVDFEACNTNGTWLAFAAVIMEYPSRRIMSSIEHSIQRMEYEYDHKTKRFWQKHKQAFRYITQRARPAQERFQVEQYLVSFLRDAHWRYPDIQVISDHPTFDLRLLDNILERFGVSLCSFRQDGSWHHPICTISYKKAVDVILHQQPVTKRFVNPIVSIPHTPLYDSVQICLDYFETIDRLESLR